MQAARIDIGVHNLMLNYLMRQALKASNTIIIPEKFKLERVLEDSFRGDKNALKRKEFYTNSVLQASMHDLACK